MRSKESRLGLTASVYFSRPTDDDFGKSGACRTLLLTDTLSNKTKHLIAPLTFVDSGAWIQFVADSNPSLPGYVRNSSWGSSEDGISSHTPFRMVNDAPSAFAGGVFKVIAPAAWPAGLPIPIATKLRTPANEPLWLNGIVSFGGQEMNSKSNTWIDLNRTLMQRAVTCGELNGSKVTIDRSALIEFPSETENFADADNDAIYLTNGDLAISNTVIGFTKDDGVDSGGSGGVDPYTGAAVTPFVNNNNWYEGTFHEGNSLSGTRNVSHTDCVFINCGQGVEAGYSNSGSSDGPNETVDGCLFAGNMVGVRWGDNYGSGYSYNASMEVKNSFVLNSFFKDTFSGQWHPTQANAWIYQTSAANSYGRAYFNVHDNHLSQPDAVNHPSNTTWDPVAHGALIEPYMPVPGSAVGVAISSYAPAQSDTSAFPGTFTVRLSTFSSKPVAVAWSVIGKADPDGFEETVLASGTLDFAPGEMFKTLAPAVASPGNYGLIRVALTAPVNAEVTGEAWFCKPPASSNPTLVARGSSGWRYRETRSEPPADWKTPAFAVPLELNLGTLGSQPVLYWFASGAMLEESTDLNQWTPSPGSSSPVPFIPNGERKFFRLRK